MASTVAAPEVIKRRSGVWTRGLIGLVASHALLFVCDRLVAHYADVSRLNLVLPDAEVLVFCVAGWGFLVSFVWMSSPGLFHHWGKGSQAPKRPKYQPPARRATRGPADHVHRGFPQARAFPPRVPLSEGPTAAEVPQRKANAEWWLTEIHRAASVASPEAAEEALRGMRKAGIVPQSAAYNSVARTCARSGDPGRAEKWLEYMALVGLDADDDTLSALAWAYARAGDAAAADECLKRAREAAVEPSAADCF